MHRCDPWAVLHPWQHWPPQTFTLQKQDRPNETHTHTQKQTCNVMPTERKLLTLSFFWTHFLSLSFTAVKQHYELSNKNATWEQTFHWAVDLWRDVNSLWLNLSGLLYSYANINISYTWLDRCFSSSFFTFIFSNRRLFQGKSHENDMLAYRVAHQGTKSPKAHSDPKSQRPNICFGLAPAPLAPGASRWPVSSS